MSGLILPCLGIALAMLIVVVWSALIAGARADEANEEWARRNHEPR